MRLWREHGNLDSHSRAGTGQIVLTQQRKRVAFALRLVHFWEADEVSAEHRYELGEDGTHAISGQKLMHNSPNKVGGLCKDRSAPEIIVSN